MRHEGPSKRWAVLLLAGLLPAAPGSPQPPDSHQRMLRELAQLASTRGQAMDVQVQAARLRSAAAAMPPAAPPDQVAKLLGTLAVAELRTGDFDAALAGFAQILDVAPTLSGDERGANVTLAEYFSGVAWLRKSLQRQCVEARSDTTCILPVASAPTADARADLVRALDHFGRVTAATDPGAPTHVAAQWLGNLSVSVGPADLRADGFWRLAPGALGSPDAVPRFRNVAAALGIDVFDYAGGMVVDDLDGDGLLDVFSTTTDIAGQVRLFRNRGDGTFEERTESAGLRGITGGLNAVQADYDGDGDLDLLILRGAWRGAAGRWPNSLMRNEGGMRFRDVTYESGIGAASYPTQVGTWADYDNDGDLDLYVGNESRGRDQYPSQLFRNDGHGSFTDVAKRAGVENYRWSKSAAWGDYDGDGWMDLYVSNLHGPNRLYRNRRDGTFADVAYELGVHGPSSSFASWFWDANEDGAPDLLVQSYQLQRTSAVGDVWHAAAHALDVAHHAELPRLYLGDGHGGFTEAAAAWGIARSTLPMAANFGDLDNDGWLDYYLGTGYPGFEGLVPNVMFRNVDGKRFVDVTGAGGFGHLAKGHGIAFADLDHDGDQDVVQQLGGFFPGDQYYNALFENPGFPGNWLTIELRSSRANRYAVGARVEIDVRDGADLRTLHRTVGTGGSFGGNPLRLHVGLGTATGAAAIRIRWPAGGEEQVGSLPGGQHYRIHEGSGAAERLARPAFRLAAIHRDSAGRPGAAISGSDRPCCGSGARRNGSR